MWTWTTSTILVVLWWEASKIIASFSTVLSHGTYYYYCWTSSSLDRQNPSSSSCLDHQNYLHHLYYFHWKLYQYDNLDNQYRRFVVVHYQVSILVNQRRISFVLEISEMIQHQRRRHKNKYCCPRNHHCSPRNYVWNDSQRHHHCSP